MGMPQCIEDKNLTEFFRDQVREAIHHQKTALPEIIEFYLVNLLLEYSNSEKVKAGGETLALILAKAMEATPPVRVMLLKDLGDLSLYISGFFPASLSRKLVDIDYYVQMGESAYGTLSQLTGHRPQFSQIFAELAGRFVESMDIIAEVSHKSHMKNDLGLLRAYELWLKTGSDRLQNLLAQEGIIPSRQITTKLQ